MSILGVTVTWGGFIIGCFVGASGGVILMCMMAMAGRTSRDQEDREAL